MPDMSSVSNLEFDWLLQAAKEGDYADQQVIKHQMRAFWTAYCLHHNLDVDTMAYDEKLLVIFDTISESAMKGKPFDFETFDLFMGEYLC